MGLLQFKGVPEPMEAFAVGWVADSRQAQLPLLLAAQLGEPFAGRTAG